MLKVCRLMVTSLKFLVTNTQFSVALVEVRPSIYLKEDTEGPLFVLFMYFCHCSHIAQLKRVADSGKSCVNSRLMGQPSL